MELSNETGSQGQDEVGPFRNKKKQKKVVFYTSIKKASKKATKIIRIEVFDGQALLQSEQNSCTPEISVQYAAQSIFDNVYCDVKRVLKNIQESMCD